MVNKNLLFPPYFSYKDDFKKCIECESKDCLSACNEKIIEINEFYPIIKFGINGCTYCDECANACKLDVLKVENKKQINAIILINPNTCIAHNQTICFSCQDICEYGAINYIGMFKPFIDFDKCTSCGFCLSVCPADSIEIKVV